MRITYYTFPDDTPEDILLEHGCGVVLKNGETVYPHSIPEDKRPLVQFIDRRIRANVTETKKLIRRYGGSGVTLHFDRDGSLFETSEVKLSGNNSRFRYNHHL